MTNIDLRPGFDKQQLSGLDEQDVASIAAVWNAPDAKLSTLIRAGGLDPKKDFIGGDFRGWPLAGQDVRGIDFTGSDLRGTGIDQAIRDETTILINAVMDDVPLPNRYFPGYPPTGRHRERSAWSSHWHAGVHRSFGNKLHLILVRFVTGSILTKDSIIRNLEDAGITDFMVFYLFSRWDVMIRVWGNSTAIGRLKDNFAKNAEINHLHEPRFLEMDEILHFPDRGKYLTLEEARLALADVSTDELKDAQEKVKNSSFFDKLRTKGLILDNDAFFVNNRIQFYTFLSSSSHPPADLLRACILRVVKNAKSIRNKSVYLASVGATRAVLRGQALPARYYDIHAFLSQLTEELQITLRDYIETETMLVANQDQRFLSLIDFDRSLRDQGVAHSPPTSALVAHGEDDQTEFKSTLRVNLRTGQKDARIELEVLKTIAAFVNTGGGRLIIGVADDGTALGLDADDFGSEDRMNRHLVNLIRDRMGPQHMGYMRVRFGDYENKRVLIVECQRGPAPVFVRDGGMEHFFMRTSAATHELSGSHLQEYIKHHF